LRPDAPTIAESGYPDYALNIWLAVTMPAKVPPAIVSKVNADIARVLHSPEVKTRLAPQGIEVGPARPRRLLS
jgi:tripartite-type tricarboxylate transporter receptor subunit TctC